MRFLPALFALVFPFALPAAEIRPNFVFMLIDDMGATDMANAGSKFYETPNLDRLAKDGLKFTHAYSACTVCSPTRSAFITGQYPARTHITDWIAGHQRPFAKLKIPEWQKGLKPEWTTLPELLKGAGYATATIGKWHLGDDSPTEHGFELNIAGNSKGSPPSYFSPYKNPQLPDGPAGEFLTERLTTEAEQFLEQNKARPLFLYLPHYAVHQPIAGKPEVVAKYQAKRDETYPQNNATYAALVQSVDDSVGRVRAKLEQLGIAERTVFVFTSDNGGLLGNGVTSNLGIRAGKGSVYEGGVRVPCIAYWPGKVKPAENATPVFTADWFATFAELAGVKTSAPMDGTTLTPLLQGGQLAARPIYWHYPHYHPGGATPYSAVRAGDWKLVHFYENDRVELYDLRSDPEEKTDLAGTQAEKAKSLRAQLDAWRKSVGAQVPVPNPDYDPIKDAQPKKGGKNAKE
jgi:arylsulfatase A-like enzyme